MSASTSSVLLESSVVPVVSLPRTAAPGASGCVRPFSLSAVSHTLGSPAPSGRRDRTARSAFSPPASGHGKPLGVTTAGARRGGNPLLPAPKEGGSLGALPDEGCARAALSPPPPFYLRSLTLDFRRTTLPISPHLCFQMISVPLPRVRQPLQVFPIVRLICRSTFNAPMSIFLLWII